MSENKPEKQVTLQTASMEQLKVFAFDKKRQIENEQIVFEAIMNEINNRERIFAETQQKLAAANSAKSPSAPVVPIKKGRKPKDEDLEEQD